MSPGVYLHYPVGATVNSDAESNTEYTFTDPTPFTPAAIPMLRLFSMYHGSYGV